MNLELGFPEFRSSFPRAGSNRSRSWWARFQAACREPDSPIRAIHHEPGRGGCVADIPPQVRPELRAALRNAYRAALFAPGRNSRARSRWEKNVVVVTPTAQWKNPVL